MFKVGDKIVWVEVKEGDMNKRFVLPSEVGIIQQLQALLSTHAGLFLIRHGEGEIKNSGLPSAGKIFESMEYTETTLFGGSTLYGHPDINQGSLRYSEGFVEAISQQQALVSGISTDSYSQGYSQQQQQQVTAPPATGGGLDELRNKLSATQGGATNPPVAPATTDPVNPSANPPAAPAAPVDPQLERDKQQAQQRLAQEQLRQQIETRGPVVQQQVADPYFSETTYFIDGTTVKRVEDILEKVNLLVSLSTVPSGGVTSLQLATWFNESIKERGYDGTFALLATKLVSLD